MYIPKLYRNEDRNKIIQFIKENSFGTLISFNQTQKIIATHIPFLFEERDDKLFAISHMSKANEQWKNLASIPDILIIFQGPHTYISSSWYNHKNVPTWDYISVHLYGKARLYSQDEAYQHLSNLVQFHESKEHNPISVDELGREYVEQEMKGMIAFEIDIHEIQAVEKLSQNRDKENLDLITGKLMERKDANSVAIANAICPFKLNVEK
ncbi:MAG: FMN-binding negative transcriptional regulator [Bacteroidetes bacterium]|nr:FMN-binding negative transcriptional regulator [Bacteroidota bacterium]